MAGNLKIVYHRSRVDDPRKILTEGFKVGSGATYGPGIYSTYELSSQMNTTMETVYGKHMYQCRIALHGYIIYDYRLAKEVYGERYSLLDQFEDIAHIYPHQVAKATKDALPDLEKYPDRTSGQALHTWQEYNLPARVRGIIFTGLHDGHVCVTYNPKNIIPFSHAEVAYTDDPTKIRWHRIDRKLYTKHARQFSEFVSMIGRNSTQTWNMDEYLQYIREQVTPQQFNDTALTINMLLPVSSRVDTPEDIEGSDKLKDRLADIAPFVSTVRLNQLLAPVLIKRTEDVRSILYNFLVNRLKISSAIRVKVTPNGKTMHAVVFCGRGVDAIKVLHPILSSNPALLSDLVWYIRSPNMSTTESLTSNLARIITAARLFDRLRSFSRYEDDILKATEPTNIDRDPTKLPFTPVIHLAGERVAIDSGWYMFRLGSDQIVQEAGIYDSKLLGDVSSTPQVLSQIDAPPVVGSYAEWQMYSVRDRTNQPVAWALWHKASLRFYVEYSSTVPCDGRTQPAIEDITRMLRVRPEGRTHFATKEI